MNKTKWIFSYYTGSSKKSVKSKMICTGINLHKSLVFSAVLGSELSTNLSSGASRPTTLTLSHLKKLGPPMCFQALGGCLRPTLRLWDSEKTPKTIVPVCEGQNWQYKQHECVCTAYFGPHKPKHTVEVFAQRRWCSGWPQAPRPPRAWKHIGSASFSDGSGWLWWTWVLLRINLSVILNLKQLRKPNFCDNYCLCKLFYFWHSLWTPESLYYPNPANDWSAFQKPLFLPKLISPNADYKKILISQIPLIHQFN